MSMWNFNLCKQSNVICTLSSWVKWTIGEEVPLSLSENIK